MIYSQMQSTDAPKPSQAACLQVAVATLREAVAAGLPGERLKDKSLASLAGTDDFRKLIDETTAGAARPATVHQAAER